MWEVRKGEKNIYRKEVGSCLITLLPSDSTPGLYYMRAEIIEPCDCVRHDFHASCLDEAQREALKRTKKWIDGIVKDLNEISYDLDLEMVD